MTDPITVRWPRPEATLQLAPQLRFRDEQTAAALRAYLAGSQVPAPQPERRYL